MSNRSLGNIKHKSADGYLLKWLKTERVFLESDGLGTDCLVTIGYFTKIAADLAHLMNFRDHLANQLLLIDIDTDTAVDLTPHLKEAQLEVMLNGDEYATILPEFEIYRMRLTHGREPSQVMTDVLGVKVRREIPNYLANFSQEWHPIHTMINAMEYSCRKVQSTYSDRRPTSKFSRTTIFFDNGGYYTG